MLTEVDVRRRRLGGAVAAVVGVALIVLGILALTGRLGAVDASRSGSEAAASAASSSSAPAAKVPLTVLNGGGPTGLASKGKAVFEEAGWSVTETGNYTEPDAPEQSTVYFPSGDDEARAAAELLAQEFPDLSAEPAPDGFEPAGVVVVLTGDWTPGQ